MTSPAQPDPSRSTGAPTPGSPDPSRSSGAPLRGSPDPFGLERGFIALVGLRIHEASGDRVVVTCPVTPDLHQPFGLVHGGVYATMAETAASVAGALWLGDQGKVVGVSNHTDFLRAVRRGELRAEATPLARGRTTQLWQIEIHDDQGRLVAHAKVRLQNVAEAPGA